MTETAQSETTSSQTTSDGGAATASDGDSSGGAESGSAPKNYSRGENQKPVSDAYRQNWNHIFGRGKSRGR